MHVATAWLYRARGQKHIAHTVEVHEHASQICDAVFIHTHSPGHDTRHTLGRGGDIHSLPLIVRRMLQTLALVSVS